MITTIGMISSCGKKEVPTVEQLKTICELSTVKAYYNNVAKSTKKAGENWWQVMEKDREYWIEYDGVAEIGIDMDKINMDVEGNVIYITLPPAEILNTRIVRETFDESCYKTNADSWWDKNKITTDDQISAINKAQSKMTERVKENKGLFERAERVARETIENYFIQINKISGSKFKVEWR